jgi:hypothetical protein
MQEFREAPPTVSRRSHRFVRALLSGAAALCAFTVVITSKPAVPPASAAPEKLARPRTVLETPVERGWSQAATGKPDPRQQLFRWR